MILENMPENYNDMWIGFIPSENKYHVNDFKNDMLEGI